MQERTEVGSRGGMAGGGRSGVAGLGAHECDRVDQLHQCVQLDTAWPHSTCSSCPLSGPGLVSPLGMWSQYFLFTIFTHPSPCPASTHRSQRREPNRPEPLASGETQSRAGTARQRAPRPGRGVLGTEAGAGGPVTRRHAVYGVSGTANGV